jgi:hypothetical protein
VATIDSGPTAYTVTATNYGSNWKYLGTIDASGETTVEVTVTLSSSATNDGKLGTIVSLVDADGTYYDYAWYGQLNGSHVLTRPVNSPTSIANAGSVAGLDLATVTHLHLQLDPSTYHDGYIVAWENLRLTGAPGPTITAPSYDPATHEFALTWTSRPNKVYTIEQTANLATAFAPLMTDIPSGGTSTTTTVPLPAGTAGFLRVLVQQRPRRRERVAQRAIRTPPRAGRRNLDRETECTVGFKLRSVAVGTTWVLKVTTDGSFPLQRRKQARRAARLVNSPAEHRPEETSDSGAPTRIPTSNQE